MTNLNDFDRSLGDFLADGPNTAPEAPVIAALAHARTTPRRPDPLLRPRSDVMARPRPGTISLRPGLALAAVALAVAAVGVAVIGSPRQDPSIPPGPSASQIPSASPSGTVFSAQIPIVVAGGSPFTLTVTDTTGELIGAESGQPGDGRSVDRVGIAADPGDPSILVVTWTGGPCETGATMTVDETRTLITIVTQDCLGDAIAFDRIVRLQFRGPVDAALWAGTISVGPAATGQGPGPTAGAPSSPPSAEVIHLDLLAAVGNPASIDIVDESGLLAGAVAVRVDGSAQVAEFITATNDDARTIRLTWPGSPCDSVHRLTIAADFGLMIDRPTCRGDAIAVHRAVLLTFEQPVDAGVVDLGLLDGRVGSGLPTWTATGGDAEGQRYVLSLFDGGAGVAAVAALFPPVGGDGDLRIEQAGQSIIRVVWAGRQCATDVRLDVDATGRSWTLASRACTDLAAEVIRAIEVKFDAPRSVDSISIVRGPDLP